MDPERGGYLVGPKNLAALALIAFELAWVDAGAATCNLAGCLTLAPIHECGTPEQRAHYMALAAPRTAGDGLGVSPSPLFNHPPLTTHERGEPSPT
jgi:alkylation response protein AidB-like acyl-CoA dehydrogenase